MPGLGVCLDFEMRNDPASIRRNIQSYLKVDPIVVVVLLLEHALEAVAEAQRSGANLIKISWLSYYSTVK